MRLVMNSTNQILSDRGLEPGGGANFLTSTVRRHADPYVPFLTGALKNTAVEDVDNITYVQPYANRRYHEARSNGLRGPYWIPRMWADHRTDIMQEVAQFTGARVQE